jgi:hypothetical protein
MAYSEAVGVSVDKPAPTKGKLSNVDIEIADNGGAIVRCRYDPKKKASDRGGPMGYIEPETKVFMTVDEALAAVTKLLKGAGEDE